MFCFTGATERQEADQPRGGSRFNFARDCFAIKFVRLISVKLLFFVFYLIDFLHLLHLNKKLNIPKCSNRHPSLSLPLACFSVRRRLLTVRLCGDRRSTPQRSPISDL